MKIIPRNPVLLLFTLILASCAPSPIITPTLDTTRTPPVAILTAEHITPTVIATPSSTLSPARTPTPTRSPTKTREPFFGAPVRKELPALDPARPNELHGLVVFRSTNGIPFNFPVEHASGPLTRFGDASYAYLWAISPDGLRAGMLSPQYHDFALNRLPDGKLQFVEDGFTLTHTDIQIVRLPDACRPPEHCDQIKLSPDGHYLGFRYGEDVCGRYFRLVDLKTGETVLDLKEHVHGYSFPINGKVEIHAGHCEGSFASFFDLTTRQRTGGVSTIGELHSRKTVPVTTAYPTLTSTPGPDILSRPVYADPAGNYDLYVGLNRTSLWMQPKTGPAVLWVREGEGFIYLK